jgi:thioredoxin-related protein
VGKYFNTTFINVSLDGETEEGELLANQYRVTGYPSLFFIDKDGNVITQEDGYHDPEELIKLARSAVK